MLKKTSIQQLQFALESPEVVSVDCVRKFLFQCAAEAGASAAQICSELAPIGRPITSWQIEALSGFSTMLMAHNCWATANTWLMIQYPDIKTKRIIKAFDHE